MANILDAIKQAVSGTGRRIAASEKAAIGRNIGRLGRAIDVVGQKLGNPFKEMTRFGNEGLSGWLEQKGTELVSQAYASDLGQPQQASDWRVQERLSQNKPIPVADAASRGLNVPTTTTQGINPTDTANQKIQNLAQGNAQEIPHLTTQELEAMGLSKDLWHGQEITYQGVRFRVQDNGDGTRTLIPIQQNQPSNNNNKQISEQDVRSAVASKDIAGVAGQDTINKILDDIRNRGLDLATATEQRLKEAAQQRYEAMLGLLGQKREEARSLAEQQKKQAQEEAELYRQQLLGKQEEEVSDITKQKEEAQKTYQQQKSELADNFRDLVRKFERVARASGAAVSGFTQGEERKILQELNKNLDKLAIKHQGVVQNLNEAINKTKRYFDDKLSELSMKTKHYQQQIDNWLRNQINAIQAQEGMALADKYDQIVQAINKADQIRYNVEQQINQEKLNWLKWTQQMSMYAAATAKSAASNNIKKASDYYKALMSGLSLADKAMQSGFAQFVNVGGQTQLVIPDFIKGGMVGLPITQEMAQNIQEQQQQQQLGKTADVYQKLVGVGAPQEVTNPLVEALKNSVQ